MPSIKKLNGKVWENNALCSREREREALGQREEKIGRMYEGLEEVLH